MPVLIKPKATWKEIAPPKFLPYCRAFAWGDLTVFAGKEPAGWHMSISHPYRYPTWDEIKQARYDLVPDEVTMAMILPPMAEFVNIHQNCFHLHEIEGDQ